jgi:hypothetical protein
MKPPLSSAGPHLSMCISLHKGQTFFAETVQATKTSLPSGLSIVFLIGAGTMLLAFILILVVAEILIDVEVKDEIVPELAELDLTAD